MRGQKVLTTSTSDDHPTPDALFLEICERWGRRAVITDGICTSPSGWFDLDAAADFANAKAPQYWGRRDNGLEQNWFGYTFCNPPFNRDAGELVDPWMRKAAREVGLYRNAERAVMLVPSRTDVFWFHDVALPFAAEICFIQGRVRFGKKTSGATFPSVVVVFDKGHVGPPKFTTMLSPTSRARKKRSVV